MFCRLRSLDVIFDAINKSSLLRIKSVVLELSDFRASNSNSSKKHRTATEPTIEWGEN